MAIQFPTPEQLSQQYLLELKTLKPDVDIKKKDSDWFIRSKVVGGVMSGVYADQRLIAEDAFPASARREALEKHLNLYFGEGFIQPTKAVGFAAVTGTIATVIPALTQFLYAPNGNIYQSTAPVTLTAITGTVPIESVSTGQSQNLLDGAELTVSSPPSGLNSAALASGSISDGRDVESNTEASERISNRIQQPPAGGTANDYATFAREADASVVDVNVIRYLYGLGTVGVVITAGTTDVDAALNNNLPVVRVPSNSLVEDVQEYIRGKQVLTDCVFVLPPAVKTVDVVARVRYVSGDNSTIQPGQTLTQEQLVQREIQRAIYKTPPGGRRFDSVGYLVLSEIEEVLDAGLSSNPYTLGDFAQILADRQVDNLAATGPNLVVGDQEIVEPGNISVVAI